MSEPKEKKTGSGPKKEPAKKTVEKKPAKSLAKKPGSQAPKRSAGGPAKAGGKKPPQPTGKKVLRGLYIALTVISAIIVAGYIGFHLLTAPPDVGSKTPDGVEVVPRPQVTTTIDPETGEEIHIEIPGLPADRKEEFYTFLLVGQSQDTGGKLSDTMMLAAYDVPNQKLSVMSLPRDTWVRYRDQTIMINGVYNAAGGDKDNRGIAGLKSAVRDLTGVYPDFHVIVQWEALGELVDAIGGVYYEVPFDMYYNDLSQHFKIDLKEGYQLLDGEGAMGLVRWRHNSDNSGHISSSYGYLEGDIGRIKTQQAFLKEVIKKCLQTDVLVNNLMEYVNIFQKNVVTDLSVANLAYFGKSALDGLDIDGVTFTTLPNRSAGDGAHLLPIGSQIVTAINEGFNPYEEPIRLSELTLATVSPLVTPTPDPEETEDPDATDDPDSTESPLPTESDEVVLPPGSFTRPSESPDPEESRDPDETEDPDATDDPEETRGPDDTNDPEESREPEESDEPEESRAPGGSASPRPSESAPPTGSPTPRPSDDQSPGGMIVPGETETPEPTPSPEPTPVPPATPPAEEEPILPPM